MINDQSITNRWTIIILAACSGSVLLLLRFRNIDIIPFIYDEPRILLQSLLIIETGNFPLTGLTSTTGLPMGALPQWLYSLPLLVSSSPDVVAIITFLGLLFAALILYYFKPERSILLALLVFLTSPWQWIYSNLIWTQNLYYAPCFFLLAVSVRVNLLQSRHHALLLGLLGAILVQIHLIAIAFFFGVVVALIVDSPRKAFRHLPAMFLSITLFSLPYLLALSRHSWSITASSENALVIHSPFALLRMLARWTGLSSPAGLEYFFDDTAAHWSNFIGSSGKILFSFCHWTIIPVVIIGAIRFGLRLLDEKRRHSKLKRIDRIILIVFPLCFLFRMIIRANIEEHSHYYFDLTVILVIFLAEGLIAIHRLIPCYFLAGILITANIYATWSFQNFIEINKGTRGIHYSVPLAEQRRIVVETCDLITENQTITVQFNITGSPVSYHYLNRTIPECRKKYLTYSANRGQVEWRYFEQSVNSISAQVEVRKISSTSSTGNDNTLNK